MYRGILVPAGAPLALTPAIPAICHTATATPHLAIICMYCRQNSRLQGPRLEVRGWRLEVEYGGYAPPWYAGMALACGNSRQAASSRPASARMMLTRRIPLDLFPRLLVLGLGAKPAVAIPQQIRRVLALPLIISVPVSQIIQLRLRGALELTMCAIVSKKLCWSQGSAMPQSAPSGQQDALKHVLTIS